MLFVYAGTIFLSAFLLFEVQPMIGKMILPWFGGSAAVWNTCLLFFQAALLAGYLYAHLSVRYLRPKHRAILHIGLIALSLATLPVLPASHWKPTHAGDPSGRILLLLTVTIGLPYILLATTSPLLQAWYAASKPGAIPYRFFALSNFGSFLALFSFPVLVEPYLTSHVQAYSWSTMYAVFAVLCSAVSWIAFRTAKEPLIKPVEEHAQDDGTARWQIRLLWIALPACASGLLLAFTTHLTQNVAPIPLLWVVPLGVYLLSFILCFESDKLYSRAVFLPLFAAAVGLTAFIIYTDQVSPNIRFIIPALVVSLFVCCMVCHGELIRLKPHPEHLTAFYLMISVGGALGGLFVAVVAPHVFDAYRELDLLLVFTAALVSLLVWFLPGVGSGRFWLRTTRVTMTVLTIALAVYLGYEEHEDDAGYAVSVRNYYGVLRVVNVRESPGVMGKRTLYHGGIEHGVQLTALRLRRTPTSYYGPDSGIGKAIRYFQDRSAVRVGVVGLGAGVTAAYCRAGDVFQFYEINPQVLQLATSWFTFLPDCPGQHRVFLGDARLTMEQQPSQQYDVLAIDAFTGDAIPVHLLTREAFAVYFRHLKPGGILAVHVSNQYLDLVPVVATNAKEAGRLAVQVSDDGESEDYFSSNDWVLVSAERSTFEDALFNASQVAHMKKGLRPWTDEYSNLIQILMR